MASTTEEPTRSCELLAEKEDELNDQEQPRGWLHTCVGYLAAIAAVSQLAVATACAQALGGLVPLFEMNEWRFIAMLIIVAPVLLVKRIPIWLKRQEVVWIAVMAFCSITFNLAYYTAATHLSVGIIGGVEPTMLLLLSAVVTVAIDRKCSYTIIIACVVCITGVLLVTQPPFLFKNNELITYRPVCGPLSCEDQGVTHPNHASSNLTRDDQHEHVAVGVGYLCLFFPAVAECVLFFTVSKKLPNCSAFVICFWVSVAGILSQLVLMFIVENPMLPGKQVCIWLLLGHCFGAGAGLVSIVLATQMIIPAIISLLCSLDIVVLFVAQYTVLRNVYQGPENWIQILGAALVLVGNVINPGVELYHYKQLTYTRME